MFFIGDWVFLLIEDLRLFEFVENNLLLIIKVNFIVKFDEIVLFHVKHAIMMWWRPGVFDDY